MPNDNAHNLYDDERAIEQKIAAAQAQAAADQFIQQTAMIDAIDNANKRESVSLRLEALKLSCLAYEENPADVTVRADVYLAWLKTDI